MSFNGFRIYTPKLLDCGLGRLRAEMVRTVEKAKMLNEKTGVASPVFIVFCGRALLYRFDIYEDEILRSIELAQKSLPQDMWTGVAFSVFQNDPNTGPRTVGYLFSRDEFIISPKAICANDDAISIEEYYKANPSESSCEWYAQWVRGETPVNNYYQSISGPENTHVEVRLCIDATAEPIGYRMNTITLVPAHGLKVAWLEKLSKNRKLVVVNDPKPLRSELLSNPTGAYSGVTYGED